MNISYKEVIFKSVFHLILLISLNIMFSNFTHVYECLTSIILYGKVILHLCKHYISLIHLALNRYIHYLSDLAVINSTAINMTMHIAL